MFRGKKSCGETRNGTSEVDFWGKIFREKSGPGWLLEIFIFIVVKSKQLCESIWSNAIRAISCRLVDIGSSNKGWTDDTGCPFFMWSETVAF